MTVRADRLTQRAKTPDQGRSVRSSYPAGSVRVFVQALKRLDYCMEPLLADAGIRRTELESQTRAYRVRPGTHYCAERLLSVR
jgi:hypothetical protein